jgi:hypothetical protein
MRPIVSLQLMPESHRRWLSLRERVLSRPGPEPFGAGWKVPTRLVGEVIGRQLAGVDREDVARLVRLREPFSLPPLGLLRRRRTSVCGAVYGQAWRLQLWSRLPFWGTFGVRRGGRVGL